MVAYKTSFGVACALYDEGHFVQFSFRNAILNVHLFAVIVVISCYRDGDFVDCQFDDRGVGFTVANTVALLKSFYHSSNLMLRCRTVLSHCTWRSFGVSLSAYALHPNRRRWLVCGPSITIGDSLVCTTSGPEILRRASV